MSAVDLRARSQSSPPPWTKIFFNFMQFFLESLANLYVCAPSWRVGALCPRRILDLPLQHISNSMFYFNDYMSTLADARGVPGMHAPWGIQILSFSCSFCENLANLYVGPPWRIGTPSYRESWIHPCLPISFSKPTNLMVLK